MLWFLVFPLSQKCFLREMFNVSLVKQAFNSINLSHYPQFLVSVIKLGFLHLNPLQTCIFVCTVKPLASSSPDLE